MLPLMMAGGSPDAQRPRCVSQATFELANFLQPTAVMSRSPRHHRRRTSVAVLLIAGDRPHRHASRPVQPSDLGPVPHVDHSLLPGSDPFSAACTGYCCGVSEGARGSA
jgi:hypothetical protein